MNELDTVTPVIGGWFIEHGMIQTTRADNSIYDLLGEDGISIMWCKMYHGFIAVNVRWFEWIEGRGWVGPDGNWLHSRFCYYEPDLFSRIEEVIGLVKNERSKRSSAYVVTEDWLSDSVREGEVPI